MRLLILFILLMKYFLFRDEQWDSRAMNGREGVSKLESMKRREFLKIDTAGDNLIDP